MESASPTPCNRSPLRASVVLLISLVGCLVGLAPACAGDSNAPDNGGATCSSDLASIKQTIFQPSCTTSGCHSGPAPAADLDLSGDVESVLVGVPSSLCQAATRVVPGRPSDSLLYQKIAGTQSCGAPMPIGGELSAEQRVCVEDWILGLPVADAGPDAPDGCTTCGADGCVDLQTDPNHCGACDVACSGTSCTAGKCGCASGLTTCGGACLDTDTDAANCGACGAACPAGASCVGGACACDGGQTSCNGKCVDTQLDTSNCGACGKVCPVGSTCSAGACACPGGQTSCNGSCVDTSSEPSNCGTCGNSCPVGQVCAAGACSLAGCGGLTQCGGACVDLQTSASNCGACGKVCPAGASCVSGSCVCPAGTSSCLGSCINTTTDATNCGGCGIQCGAGQSCSGGVCSCPNGTTLCNGACVDTKTDTKNCGACGVTCPAAQTCSSGACACANGGMLCNGTCVDTQSDASSCGTCGNACALGQTCVSGACACSPVSVSFAANVQPIFTAHCNGAGCHAGAVPASGLSLVSGQSYSKLVNVTATECMDGRKRVLPGQPSVSYLVDKLMGVDICFGTPMPKTGMISQAEIQTITNWICSGAPNN